MSARYTLSQTDLEKWGKNSLIFLGPALLVLLASIVDAIPSDWAYGTAVLFVLNLVTDLLRKFLAGK